MPGRQGLQTGQGLSRAFEESMQRTNWNDAWHWEIRSLRHKQNKLSLGMHLRWKAS
jgi:hypothetical protein